MIRLATAALAEVVGLKAATLYVDALFVIDKTFQQVTGFNSELLNRMDDASLLASLSGPDGPDPERLVIVGQLFQEEAEIYASIQQPDEARWRWVRALNLYVEAALTAGAENFSPPVEEIQILLQKLDLPQLPIETLYPLFCYQEQAGDYAQADQSLKQILEKSGSSPDIMAEIRSFYQRMLDKTDQELEQGGLIRTEIENRLENLTG